MNYIIILNNKTCRLDLRDNPEVIGKIRKEFSWQDPNYMYSIAHKQGGWNGYSCLLSSKNTFPAGLQSRAERILKDNNILYELIDKRQSLDISKELDLSKRFKKIGFEPRDYQLKAVEATINNVRGVLECCTGSGKTAIGSLIAAKYNTTTIIYVIGLQLLSQFHQTLTDLLGEKIGFIGNGVCDIQKINVASVWTIGKALDIKGTIFEDDYLDEKEDFKLDNKLKILELLKQTKLHIIDEMHASNCYTIKNIVKNIDPVRIYGMSGTPYKNSGEGEDLVLEGIFGKRIIQVSAAELIERKILVQPIIKFVNVPPTPVYGRTYAEVYNQFIVENDTRNQLILKETQNLINKKCQTLVLFRQIKHGKILFDLFKSHNINCELLNGSHSLEKREEIKQRLLKGEIDVILASSIFDVGIDISSLNAAVFTSSGKSKCRNIQRVGRLIRGHPGKEQAYIVDFIDNARYLIKHSRIRYQTYTEQKGFKVYAPSKRK